MTSSQKVLAERVNKGKHYCSKHHGGGTLWSLDATEPFRGSRPGSDLGEMDQFPMAAVTIYQAFRGLKQR